MTELLERALAAVRRMPDTEQDAIARAMLNLTEPGEPANLDPDELQDVLEALAEVERGDIATAEDVEAAFRAFRR